MRMKFLVALVILGIAASCSAETDAEKWIKTGLENANRDMEKFDAIIAQSGDGRGNALLTGQLKALEAQIDEAAANNENVVPKIDKVVQLINWLLKNPGWFKKGSMKGLIWFLDGKRDNKSYYVLDGAQQWVEKRLPILAKRNEPFVADLTTDLKSLRNKTIQVRDQLNRMAGTFVKGLKSLHTLTGNIGENLKQLDKTAEEMKAFSEEKDNFLKNTVDLKTQANDLVQKHQ